MNSHISCTPAETQQIPDKYSGEDEALIETTLDTTTTDLGQSAAISQGMQALATVKTIATVSSLKKYTRTCSAHVYIFALQEKGCCIYKVLYYHRYFCIMTSLYMLAWVAVALGKGNSLMLLHPMLSLMVLNLNLLT